MKNNDVLIFLWINSFFLKISMRQNTFPPTLIPLARPNVVMHCRSTHQAWEERTTDLERLWCFIAASNRKLLQLKRNKTKKGQNFSFLNFYKFFSFVLLSFKMSIVIHNLLWVYTTTPSTSFSLITMCPREGVTCKQCMENLPFRLWIKRMQSQLLCALRVGILNIATLIEKCSLPMHKFIKK